jgi:uncharacterized membrane protein
MNEENQVMQITGAAKTVDAGRPIEWLKQGWGYFMKNPGVWIAITVVLIIANVIAQFIPVIGPLGMNLVMPGLIAGLMIGCRSLQQGGELRFDHVFEGFKQNSNGLIMIGVWYLVGSVAIALIAVFLLFMVGGSALLAAMAGSQSGAPQLGLLAVFLLLIVFLIIFTLVLILYMAVWFAPPLVVFGNMEPLAAMKASFAGSLKNILPYLVYGIVVFVLAILAVIPIGLGLLVLLPVLYGAQYAAYQDIFE